MILSFLINYFNLLIQGLYEPLKFTNLWQLHGRKIKKV